MTFDFTKLFQLSYWKELFTTNVSTLTFFVNILDIIVVWYLIYKLIQLLRGTKAIQLFKGVAMFIVVRVLAELIGLHTLSWLMDQIITYGVIAAIVIFQPEIRRGLEHLGRATIFNTSKKEINEGEEMIKGFDKAIQYMSKRKIGALITIERNTGLEEYIETGIRLDADITGELLINIFIPNTPLHDGAVIVRNGKIVVSCAYLPLSDSPLISKEYGTRHRAAMGISEVSDALTLVVSEETGGITFTLNSQMYTELTRDEYMQMLHDVLIPNDKNKEKNNFFQTLRDEWQKLNRGGKE